MMATVLGVTLNYSLNENRKHLEISEQVMLNLLGDLSRIALLTAEYDELQPYIDEVIADPHVETVLLVNHKNRVVVSSEYSYIGRPVPELGNTETRIWRYREISNASGSLGGLAIRFSNKNLLQTNHEVFNLGVRIALTGMVLIAFVGILIGFLLTRRLDKLSITAQRLADGDFHVRTEISGQDELSIVGQAFNRMAGKVEHNIAELETLTEDLTATNLALDKSRIALRELVSITGAPDLTHDEKLNRLLDTGREYFDLPIAVLTSTEDFKGKPCRLKISGDTSLLKNQSGPLNERCARQLIESNGEPLDVPNLKDSTDPYTTSLQGDWNNYLAAAVLLEGEIHCTLEFAGTRARTKLLSQWDHELLKVMAQWIGDELERQIVYESQQQHRIELARASRMSAIGEMATSLAHELSQPLTAVMNYCNGCMRILSGGYGNTTKLKEGMQLAVESATLAADIISNVREFVRKGDVEHALVDLSRTARSVATLMALEAQRHEVEIKTDLTDVLSPVKGNMIQLEQVLLNFIRNGIDSIEKNRSQERIVRINTSQKGKKIQVTVTDSGEGISEDVLPKIFDAFYTTKLDGMGIGLSISRSIIEAHLGKITARSLPEGGAEFSFELPEAEDD